MTGFEKSSTLAIQYSLVTPFVLSKSDRAGMYALMVANYDGMDQERFEKDLEQKDLVIVLRDRENVIQGFSTVAFNPNGIGLDGYDVIFSGDTIIAPEHWGSPALSQGFRSVLGGFKAAVGDRSLYWFLISKGYRTYMYLPLYFKRYFPAAENDRYEDLSKIAGTCAAALYPEAWDSISGLIRFPIPHDRLKPELAAVEPKKSNNPHVRFFLERNPGYFNGDELVCLVRIEKENLLRPDLRYFGVALEGPHSIYQDVVQTRSLKLA